MKKTPATFCRRDFLVKTPLAAIGLMAAINATPKLATAAPARYRHNINSAECISCGACADICPTQAIVQRSGTYIVQQNLCIGCGACAPECPVEAISPGTLIVVPTVDLNECIQCAACDAECPTGAMSSGVITSALCSGCRACVPVCPVAAIS